MYLGIVLSGCFFLAVSAVQPNVRTIPCSTSSSLSRFDHCLFIDHDGGAERYAGLLNYKGSDRVLEGVLLTKEGQQVDQSRISMTLNEDDSAHVLISDPLADDFQTMASDLKSGVSERLIVGDNMASYGKPVSPSGYEEATEEAVNDLTMRDTSSVPNYEMKILIFVDHELAEKFGEKTKEKIHGTEAHWKTYYAHKSMGVTFNLTFLPYRVLNESMGSTKPLSNFNPYIAKISKSLPEANAYAFLRNGGFDGYWGMAFVSTACSPNKALRTSVSAWLGRELYTAWVLSHEVAHNLGAANRGSKKKSADGRPCGVEGGFMRSYSPHHMYRQWSPCSADEMLHYLHRTINREGKWCMPKVGAPEESTNHTYCNIYLRKTNMVMDVSRRHWATGLVVIWGKHNGDNQQFFWDGDQLRAKNYPLKVLTCDTEELKRSGGNTARAYLSPKDSGADNQRWRIVEHDHGVSIICKDEETAGPLALQVNNRGWFQHLKVGKYNPDDVSELQKWVIKCNI